ncbi:MAG: DUF2202 domain-containing protein [Aquificae bacterium]|nr:DUF2202 domain-containing protein [Aquificota bacterium]
MKKSLLTLSAVALGSVFLFSCGDGGGDGNDITIDPYYDSALQQNFTYITTAPVQDLSAYEVESLIFMWNEEKMAKDLYYALYEEYSNYPTALTFKNIAERSETTHQKVIELLLDKYQLSVDDQPYDPDRDLEDDYPPGEYSIDEVKQLYDNLLAQGQVNIIEALKVGCIVEVVDVEDLNERLALVDNQDIILAFEALRQGSYNHYWAFYYSLQQIGVEEGCCVLGDEYCKTKEEFPPSNRAPY